MEFLSALWHSLQAAALFVGLALTAWALDWVVALMRRHNADPMLCSFLHLTALGLVVVDCLLVLSLTAVSAIRWF